MWHEKLDGTFFLHKLYKEIPLLKNVRIESICFDRSIKHFWLVFDMPTYADCPPNKWGGTNTVSIELVFSNVKNITFTRIDGVCRGDIEIYTSDSSLMVSISGESISLKAKASDGQVGRLSAYVLKD
jgi:hypothetical protein